MATCRECMRMGYPLTNGLCKGCRGREARPTLQNADREKCWKNHTKVVHKDPKPLLGENYDQKEFQRHYYPFRRMPQCVPARMNH